MSKTHPVEMADSGAESLPVCPKTHGIKTKEKCNIASDFTAKSDDIYRMCKKIAQLTKVIYNLNVKNDELEIYQSCLQHDYEKKLWKLTADVQQHVSNAASMMRTETTRSAEISQLRTHLDEQMSQYQCLSEELKETKEQHEEKLSAVASEHEQQLLEQQSALAAAKAAHKAEVESLQDQLKGTEAELAAEQVARLSDQEQAALLKSQLLEANHSLQEQQDRAEMWRAESERATAENDRRAESEVLIRQELAAKEAAYQQERTELHSMLTNQKQQLGELGAELAGSQDREEQLSSQLVALQSQKEHLQVELSTVKANMQEQSSRLQERDATVQEQETQLKTLTDHLQTRCDQLHSKQALLEACQLEVRQKSAELARSSECLQTLRAEGAAAKTRTDQLSQLLIAREAEITQLETQLAEAAAPSADPPADPDELQTEAGPGTEALQTELAEVRERLAESERQREEQAHLMQAALEESAALESECRRRVEALQTVTEEREQQLMEDAETRLREVRRDCKLKLEQQQQAAEERASSLRQTVEAELHSQRQALEEQSAVIDRKLAEVEALRSFEAEVVQLRGLTHELMRELRVGTRQVELCRTQEARTAEENRRLSELLSRHSTALSSVQKEQQQLRLQLEQQCRMQAEQERSALDAQWEDRLREERRALKAELDCLHAEEKHLAVESMRLGREQQLQEAEQRVRQLQQQLECAAEETRQMQSRHQLQIQQREREAEAIICDLHQQLQALQNAVPDKPNEDVLPNGVAREQDRRPAESEASDASDAEQDGGDVRQKIDRALRRRPELRAGLTRLLEGLDGQLTLSQQELTLARELRDCDQAEHRAAVADLQERLAAAERGAEQLRTELSHLLREHDRVSQLLADSERERLSAAAAEARQRPEDLETIQRLEQTLQHTQQQTDTLRREKQQLGLELANRDASYSRLFPTGAPRVGLIDPTGGRAAPPGRQQRRPAASRTGKR